MPDAAMDPMTLAMLSGDPDALETMRKYALAQQLQQMSLGGAQQPQQLGLEGKYPHAARVGPISAVAPLIQAFMAKKGFETAGPAMTGLVKKAYGIDQGDTPQTAPQGGATPPQATPASPSPAGPQGASEGPNPYTPVTPQDIAGTNVPGTSPFVRMQSKTSLEGAKAYREMQIAAQKQQHAGTIAQLDNLIKSDHPADYAKSDTSFQTMWPGLARQIGVDPESGYTDQNVRRALGMIRNPLAASVGIPEEKIPEQMLPTTGAYGYRGQQDPVTKEEKEVQPAQLPTYAETEVYDPKSGNTVKQYHQTGGWFPGMKRDLNGSPSPGAPPAQNTGGATGPANVDTGMGVPKASEFESAGYAQYMRGGLQGVRGLEAKGVGLSPQARAIVIDVATAEGGGITSQILRQEMLKHGLNLEGPQSQAYLASLMPMLQAAGHAMAGARLTAGQMRTNFESLIPLDVNNKPAMAQIDQNRNNFYSSLLGQSAGAIRSPLYQSTLGADFDHLKAGHKQVKGQWYEKREDGKVYPAGP